MTYYEEFHRKSMAQMYIDRIKVELENGRIPEAISMLYLMGITTADNEIFDDVDVVAELLCDGFILCYKNSFTMILEHMDALFLALEMTVRSFGVLIYEVHSERKKVGKESVLASNILNRINVEDISLEFTKNVSKNVIEYIERINNEVKVIRERMVSAG